MERLKSIKNSKIRALFSEISSAEYFLILVPFALSLVTLYGGFTLIVMLVFMGLSLLFLFGARWRILYFGILIYFGLFILIKIGRPDLIVLGADRESAIRAGIDAIFTGQNPFKSTTHLGHNPSPLPFTYFFYIPIYLISGGYTSYMTLVMFCIFSSVLFYKFIDTKQNVMVLPVISFIVASQSFLHEILIQSDLIVTGMLLCLTLLLLPDQVSKPKRYEKLRFIKFIPEEPKEIDRNVIIFAILFGCLLAMRIHNWLIVGVVALYVLKIYGFKRTLILGLITIATFLAIMLPFVLQDPSFFWGVNPIAHNSGKFAIWRNFQPFDPLSRLSYLFVKTFFDYGLENSFILSISIILFSILFGLIKCENKFHLFLIITYCFSALIFFYFFTIYFAIISDYISIVMIPFIFAFLYTNFGVSNSKRNPAALNTDDSATLCEEN